MSLENTDRKNVYDGNDLNEYWPFTFSISTRDGSDIGVYITNDQGVTGDRLTSGYSVDITNKRIKYPDPIGTKLPGGFKITLARETPLTQSQSYSTQSFNPKTIEFALDKLTMMVQETYEKLSRTLFGDISVAGVNYSLPLPESGKFLGWNFDANQIINYAMMNGPVELQLKYDTNVRWYGAKGDGITDDTTAIKEAINAVANLGGGNLYFPPGVYLISDTLDLIDNVSLLSQNRGDATIKLADNANCTMIYVAAKTNITIIGITLDGNNANQVFPTSEYYGIDAYNSVGLTVFNCVIKNICAEGVHFDGPDTKDGKCMYNTFTDCMWSGICTDAPNVTIIGNTVRRCRNNYITLNYPGCICIGNETYETTVNTDQWACGINLGHTVPDLHSDKTIVTGNIVHDLPYTGIQVGNSSNVIVTGNIVYNITKGFGITVAAESKDVIVQGNEVFDIFWGGVANRGYGIYLSHAWNAIVKGNIVHNTDSHGISLWDSTRCQIESNKIRNVGKAVDGNYINVVGDLPGSPDTVLKNNECWDEQVTKTALYGIYVDDSPDVSVEGNKIYYSKRTAIAVLNSTDINISHNRIKYVLGFDGESHGIWLSAGSTDATIAYNKIIDVTQGHGIYIYDGSHGPTVVGNKIRDIKRNGVAGFGDGILFSGLVRVIADFNSIRGTDRFGIALYNSQHNSCIGNIISNIGKTSAGNAIDVSGTSAKNAIVGNVTFDDQEVKTTVYGVKNYGMTSDLILGNIACNEEHLTKGLYLAGDGVNGYNRFSDTNTKIYGQAILTGTNNVTITHDLGFNSYKVILTKTTGTGGAVKLTGKYNNAFTIASSDGADTGVVDWLIVT